MVAARVAHKKRSTSTQHPVEEQQLQFMPTPMVTTEVQTENLTSGPAATLRNVNVPTKEVNFEVLVDELQSIDDTEWSWLRAERAQKRRNAKISTATSKKARAE